MNTIELERWKPSKDDPRNLDLPHLLMYLADHEQAERFYIFTYPYWTEDHTAKYYRLDLSEVAIKGAQAYRNMIWDKLRGAAEADGIIPKIPELYEPSS